MIYLLTIIILCVLAVIFRKEILAVLTLVVGTTLVGLPGALLASIIVYFAVKKDKDEPEKESNE